MTLLPNWREVLARAWSIKWIIAAGLFSGAEVALPIVHGWLPVSPGIFAALSLVATAGAFITRLLVQRNPQIGENIDDDITGVGA